MKVPEFLKQLEIALSNMPDEEQKNAEIVFEIYNDNLCYNSNYGVERILIEHKDKRHYVILKEN